VWLWHKLDKANSGILVHSNKIKTWRFSKTECVENMLILPKTLKWIKDLFKIE
jgi:hypothetical protein